MSSIKQLLPVFTTMFALTVAAADATATTINFTGTVTFGGTLATVGSNVTGSFSYDSDTPPWFTLPHEGFYSISAPSALVVNFSGHTVVADSLSIFVVNNFGGNIEDSFEVDGNAPTIDGILYPNGTFTFVLASAPGAYWRAYQHRIAVRPEPGGL